MERSGYERYGLLGNPFRDLASETIDTIEMLHVNQPFDRDLMSMAEEVREHINRSVVLMMGGHGMGKTERLMLIQNEAAKRGDLCVYRNVGSECQATVQSICEGIVIGYKERKKRSLLAPKWMSEVVKLTKDSKKTFMPDKAGSSIAEALNQMAPSFLLLNDLQGLKDSKEADCLNSVMNALLNSISPGVMVVLTCETDYFKDVICGEGADDPDRKGYDDRISKKNALKDRINRKFTILPMTKNEAMLMIGKRLLVKRLVDDLPSLYPFNDVAVARMNDAVQGNPRRLLKLADHIIDTAVKTRAVQIDEELVGSALLTYPEGLPTGQSS